MIFSRANKNADLVQRIVHQLWSGAHMAKELDPREMFEHVALALCPGQSWPSAIAELMGVRGDTIRHWRSGRSQLRSDHFATMLSLVTDKQAELAKVEVELRAWLARQPQTEGDA
jgi:hypothetical protein